MSDPPLYPDADQEDGVGPDRASTTGTPRWVKVFGIVALIVVVLFVVLFVFGGGGHGPGRHSSSGLGGHAPLSGVTEPMRLP
jgi:hypothetical protein